MLAFPNAKINLGLNILSKRPDGYHNLESCFYPIPWTDVLEITKSKKLSFKSTGLAIPGDEENNLCIKAYHLLADDYDLPPVHIHLHKVIPMGAGLGGGSADGAFVLKMLNEISGLNLPAESLEHYAARLGSDCPFFIQNKPVFASGTGTTFQDVTIDLSGNYLAVFHPGIHIGTQEAYSEVQPHIPAERIIDLVKKPIEKWKAVLRNDFEDSVFPKYPQIKLLKEKLYHSGALYASMSGSGSAVFGIFETKPALTEFYIFQL